MDKPKANTSAADVFYGKQAIGQKQLNQHLNGKRIPRGEAIKAACYSCCSGYVDGKVDCGIPDCPLHPYMPYKGKK
jgi:hypothetical protein